MIPETIHYCWFGGSTLPLSVRKCIKSWEKLCPGYEIKRWDESNFDVTIHPFMKTAYEAKAWAFVSDYARLKVIYDNGGIYLDTDVELVKNIDSLRKYQCYFGIQQQGHICASGLGFGAVKYNVMVKMMLDQYDGLVYTDSKKKEIACPYLNNRVLKKLGYQYKEEPVEVNGAIILPPRFLDPISCGKNADILTCEDTISIHHYSASWLGKKTQFRRKIIAFLGQDKVIRCRKYLKEISKVKL